MLRCGLFFFFFGEGGAGGGGGGTVSGPKGHPGCVGGQKIPEHWRNHMSMQLAVPQER